MRLAPWSVRAAYAAATAGVVALSAMVAGAAATGPRACRRLRAKSRDDAQTVIIEATEPVRLLGRAAPDPRTVLVELRNVSVAGAANRVRATGGSLVSNVALEDGTALDGSAVGRVRARSRARPRSIASRSTRNTIRRRPRRRRPRPPKARRRARRGGCDTRPCRPASRSSGLAERRGAHRDRSRVRARSPGAAAGTRPSTWRAAHVRCRPGGGNSCRSMTRPAAAAKPAARAAPAHGRGCRAAAGASRRRRSHPRRHAPAPQRPHRPPGRPRVASATPATRSASTSRTPTCASVLRTFAEISGLNMVIDPAVQGTVDIVLTEVPWDQALEIILRGNQLGYTVDGTIVRIAPLKVLAAEEDERRKLADAQALSGDLRVRTFALSYAKATELQPLLTRSALSQRGQIQVDPRTNTLIITDLPDRLTTRGEPDQHPRPAGAAGRSRSARRADDARLRARASASSGASTAACIARDRQYDRPRIPEPRQHRRPHRDRLPVPT